MVSNTKTWLLLTKTSEDPQWIGDQYSDEIGASYKWNHKVPNHSNIKEGDRIAIWDGENLLGISVIDAITITENQHAKYQRCPFCFKGLVNPPRVVRAPRYKCKYCKEEFQDPNIEDILVTGYSSNHQSAWVSISPLPIRDNLIEIAVRPKTQHSIRELIPEAFDSLLAMQSIKFRSDTMNYGLNQNNTSRDFQEAPNDDPSVKQNSARRVRNGQGAFRDNLLRAYGSRCAITGEGLEEVLDAIHILPHSESGINALDNGLLMRTDLHNLFDSGLMSIDPKTKIIFLDNKLKHTSYWKFNGVKLRDKVDGTEISEKYLQERENYLQHQ